MSAAAGEKQTEKFVDVVSVDVEGRPLLVRRYDTETGEFGVVEFVKGYRPAGGVESNYSPVGRMEKESRE
jgi:hypothetical protein